MQARHELKHSLNWGDYMILRSRLRAVMRIDPHADANGEYRVRSLYFDTPSDKVLREKTDGVDRRHKYRIRRYMGDSDYIMLEFKSKAGNLSWKSQAQLDPEEVIRITAGDVSWMEKDHRELVRELHAGMKNELLAPRTIVDYVREPFESAGGVRITFDRDVHTGLYSTDFFNDALPVLPAGGEIVIMEVKYGQFFPEHLVKVLQLGQRQAGSASKYQMSRMHG